jgi:hypothetical protein
VRAGFVSGAESTVCGRGRRGAAVRKVIGGAGEFGVVGGGVVGELVFRHSPTCQLVSDHRGK